MSMTPWRSDPDLLGRFQPGYPDDMQVMVHDGEPRRTPRSPEGCWVRVTSVHAAWRYPNATEDAQMPVAERHLVWVERTVYRATLLNQPHQLLQNRAGDEVLFVHVPGLPLPLQVREDYLEERLRWAFTPCTGCGSDQGMDLPSVMQRTRFPNPPSGGEMLGFTSFCGCGGTQVVARIGETPEDAVEGGGRETSPMIETASSPALYPGTGPVPPSEQPASDTSTLPKRPWWRFW